MQIKEAIRRIEATEYGDDLACVAELLEAVRMEGERREMMAKQSGFVVFTFLPDEHNKTPIVIVLDEVIPFLVHNVTFDESLDDLDVEESDRQRGIRVRARHTLSRIIHQRAHGITIEPAVSEFQLLRRIEKASLQAREDRLREFENHHDAIWEDA